MDSGTAAFLPFLRACPRCLRCKKGLGAACAALLFFPLALAAAALCLAAAALLRCAHGAYTLRRGEKDGAQTPEGASGDGGARNSSDNAGLDEESHG